MGSECKTSIRLPERGICPVSGRHVTEGTIEDSVAARHATTRELAESVIGSGERWIAQVPGVRHEWLYRGQVIPRNARIEVHAQVDAVDDATRTLTGSGLLLVDGKPIYKMQSFTVRLTA